MSEIRRAHNRARSKSRLARGFPLLAFHRDSVRSDHFGLVPKFTCEFPQSVSERAAGAGPRIFLISAPGLDRDGNKRRENNRSSPLEPLREEDLEGEREERGANDNRETREPGVRELDGGWEVNPCGS